jgi:hypothetical protein
MISLSWTMLSKIASSPIALAAPIPIPVAAAPTSRMMGPESTSALRSSPDGYSRSPAKPSVITFQYPFQFGHDLGASGLVFRFEQDGVDQGEAVEGVDEHDPVRQGLFLGQRLVLVERGANEGQLSLDVRSDLPAVVLHLDAGDAENQAAQRSPEVEQYTADKQHTTAGAPEATCFHLSYYPWQHERDAGVRSWDAFYRQRPADDGHHRAV